MRGDICIRARCLMPEKLLQRALESGACFRDARMLDDHWMAIAADRRSADIFLSLCDRYHIPAQIDRVRGLSALLQRVRRRATLLAAAVTFAAVCALFFGRIWRVDIAFTGSAAAQGDRAAVQALLDEYGIRPGMPRSVDALALAQRLQAHLPSMSYVGVRVEGVRVTVEAAPETPAPPVYDLSSPRDLCAACDGVVVYAEAQSGVLCVKPGDTVRRGQTLIRGEEAAPEGETRPIAALGIVKVRAWITGEAAMLRALPLWQETGRVSESLSLKLMWRVIALREGEAFEFAREDIRPMPIVGLFLPVEILQITRREISAQAQTLDPSQWEGTLCTLALSDAARRYTLDAPADAELSRKWTNFDTDGQALRAQAVYEYITNAAIARESLSQDSNSTR